MSGNISNYDFHVRGEIPALLAGSLVVACNRRNKDHSVFSRWHDSQADLVRIDLTPGKPGRMTATVLSVDPQGGGLHLPKTLGEQLLEPSVAPTPFYETQPNHGINIAGGRVWATNLLFGAPLEVDLETWQPTRVLRFLERDEQRPQISTTAHFAWSLDRRYAYFHQSLFQSEQADNPVKACQLSLIQIDTRTGGERLWHITPPLADADLETANFHSAFYFEMEGRRYVGLLRTGALLESLAPHSRLQEQAEHRVLPMPRSTIWMIELDETQQTLAAELLPGLEELEGIALSHLEVDSAGGDGFVLFANYKQADVAEETHGENLYGEQAERVCDHYSGMVVEAINYGSVMRYEYRKNKRSLSVFSRPYDPAQTSEGHTWLPINLALDSSGQRVFGTFSGFRPRLLPKHIAQAYPGKIVDPQRIRYVPPLLMRFEAANLEPDRDSKRRHVSYAEPIAMALVGENGKDYVCTFSPEVGLRIYDADDLTAVVCHAVCHELWSWEDTHFRPDPAHMQFVSR
ncbi:MAG: hypothetical protein H7Y30_00135 [Pyrinomonadaceae bacterium]|nr:hypothetical protein [Pyrinomonadaceae bacterium]